MPTPTLPCAREEQESGQHGTCKIHAKRELPKKEAELPKKAAIAEFRCNSADLRHLWHESCA